MQAHLPTICLPSRIVTRIPARQANVTAAVAITLRCIRTRKSGVELTIVDVLQELAGL